MSPCQRCGNLNFEAKNLRQKLNRIRQNLLIPMFSRIANMIFTQSEVNSSSEHMKRSRVPSETLMFRARSVSFRTNFAHDHTKMLRFKYINQLY